MDNLREYELELIDRELTPSTIKKYLRDTSDFIQYIDSNILNKKLLIGYKESLTNKYKVSTINNKITIINNYLSFIGEDIKLKQQREQRRSLGDNILTESDYKRLIRMAESRGKIQLKYLMKSLYYTGVRISELEYLTVESLEKGYMDVKNKGKHRVVPLSKKLVKELKNYTKDSGIFEGVIFSTQTGKVIDRSNTFRELKKLAGEARVKKDKVYPHSFRHLFAKQWLKHNNNNVLELANLLGHSSLETTRIYTALSIGEQRDTISF